MTSGLEAVDDGHDHARRRVVLLLGRLGRDGTGYHGDAADIATAEPGVLVFRGALDRMDYPGADLIVGSPSEPNLWWPNDRAWFVATEIDLVSTYVGGRADLVRAIVASPDLEAFEVAADGPYAS